MDLNNKQLAFVEEYLANGMNGTQAYLKAYPTASYKTSEANSARLLTNAKIQKVIQAKQLETSLRNDYCKDESVSILASIARNDINRNSDRIKAVSELNKLLGYNEPDRIESTNKIIWNEELLKDEDIDETD